jgi:RHS repeat-associated protein
MTTDETGRQFVYDAWNRLVIVKDSGGTTLKTYGYDGLNRRVTETAGGTTTDLYYSDQWQTLEEKVGSNYTKRYVWSPVYVDAMVLRDRDTDGNGSLDERLWVQQDANWNVTALVDGSGAVVERYAYDPYGVVTIYDASYGTRSSSSYAWTQGFQGMFFDAVSGSYKSRGRTDISPTLGRAFQPDPMGLAPDSNYYRWEMNNPLARLDPFGLDANKRDGAHGYDIEWFTSLNSPYEWCWGFPDKGYRVAATYFYANVACSKVGNDYHPDLDGPMKYDNVIEKTSLRGSYTPDTVYQGPKVSHVKNGKMMVIELDIAITKKRVNPAVLAGAFAAPQQIPKPNATGGAAGALLGIALALSDPDYAATYQAKWTVECDCDKPIKTFLGGTGAFKKNYLLGSSLHWEDDQTYAADQALTPGDEVPNRGPG